MEFANAIKVFPTIGDAFIIDLPESVDRNDQEAVEAWLSEYVNFVEFYELVE